MRPALDPLPRVLVSSSAIGYYGNTGDAIIDESSPRGEGFLAELVETWERAADPARDAGIRVVHPRTGLVVSSKGGTWEDAWELKDYPATMTTSAGNLYEGEVFRCQLSAPVKVFGVRVVGKPACGINPKQAYSSCVELQAFEK